MVTETFGKVWKREDSCLGSSLSGNLLSAAGLKTIHFSPESFSSAPDTWARCASSYVKWAPTSPARGMHYQSQREFLSVLVGSSVCSLKTFLVMHNFSPFDCLIIIYTYFKSYKSESLPASLKDRVGSEGVAHWVIYLPGNHEDRSLSDSQHPWNLYFCSKLDTVIVIKKISKQEEQGDY